VLFVAILASVGIGIFLSQAVSSPLVQLTNVAAEISKGNFDTKAEIVSTDEVGALAAAFNSMTERLRNLIGSLEQRVAERTRNLELAAEVGRSVSQVRVLDVMLTDAAELIRERFGLYYVQVYLANPSKNYLDLQAGTGNVGVELLKRKHRLPFDETSINGRAALEQKSVVIANTTESPAFKPNPLLPDTRSEMAVPLLVGDSVVGVLDMQSAQPGALTLEVLPAFEALAGQLAIAIQNANFLAETEQARAELEEQARRLVRKNYADYMESIHETEEIGYLIERGQIAPLPKEQTEAQNALVTPIAITGEDIGDLVVELEGQSPIARTNEFLEAISRQVAQQVESLRLLDNAERYRAEAEKQATQTQSALAQVEEQALQTQSALARVEAQARLTQRLSEAGLLFTRALNLQDVVKTAVETLEISEINRAVLEIFNYNSEDDVTGVDVVANWWNGTGREPTTVGSRYATKDLPLLELFLTPVPVFIEDALHDARIDNASLQTVERLKIHGVAVLPLSIADRQIGVLLLEAERPYKFSQDEISLFSAMAPQISTVLENRRQFERARQQADREGMLNLISQKIQNATTVEAVLQIAAREIGHALDLPMTVAQLSMKDKE